MLSLFLRRPVAVSCAISLAAGAAGALIAYFAMPVAEAEAGHCFRGKVVHVADGDTVAVLVDEQGKHERKVRLDGIDAPEKRQPFGARAGERMKTLAHGREAEVCYRKKDRYGRYVGRLTVDGRDAGLDLLASGYAWVYARYDKELEPARRRAYYAAEEEARKNRLGLWRDPQPVPPWEWRKARREASGQLAQERASGKARQPAPDDPNYVVWLRERQLGKLMGY
ncbi:MAG: thermonuclease family protein [Duodenibacillus sp.]|nr:thermonuclease family protein [Duodenibacillus sp.]